ncbi:MAG: methylamine utilization protein [Pseudomonadota bacterium]
MRFVATRFARGPALTDAFAAKSSRIRRLATIFLALASQYVAAEAFEIQLLQKNGEPMAGAVVALEPVGSQAAIDAPMPAQPGTMDQINRQFAPHILVVQRGAEVSFPNSDSIKHHVYSFSQAKTFEIKLYNDASPEALVFERAGEVELGCNVHDWMLGYIYVVDTPFFTRSDETGRALLEAPEGEYRLSWWHPRIRGSESERSLQLASGQYEVTVTLSRSLLRRYEQEEFTGGDYD